MQNIIASHIVKPSSPTSAGIKNHKLSSLDQIATPVYIPLIFFYEHHESKHHEEISRRLKQSLSEILTIFYPLAGTIKQNSFVDCNDRGAKFVEARVHSRLAQLIQNPKMEELNQLVPVDSSSYNDNAFQLLVKTNYFDCGGIAVGVCLSHKIGDVASFVTFMNAWAATCRGESSKIIQPCFDLALRFPPKDSLASRFQLPKEKIVTKRLVFDGKMVEKFRKQTPASRVVAVSAFIWQSFVEANRKAKAWTGETSSSFFPASHIVNLRPRTVPQMPDQTFGNCITYASPAAVVSSSEENEYVSKLEASIRAVDDDYINKVLADDSYFRALVEQFGDLFTSANCTFTSWRFPVYDVDFGWGKPVWVCTATMPHADVIILMSTPSGDGIEDWVNYIPHDDDDDFFKTLQANYVQ